MNSCEERIDKNLESTMEALEYMTKLIDADDWDDLDKDTLDFVENYMGYSAEGDIDEVTESILDGYGIFFGLDDNYHGIPFEYADNLEVFTEEYGYELAEACEEMGYAPLHWQFSWGGPSDGMIITLRKGRWVWDVVKAYYYFQDWFDGAWRELTEEQLEILRQVVQYMCIECLFF